MTPAYKYRCRVRGVLMMTNVTCTKRAVKGRANAPLDERHESKVCRECPGAELLKTPIPIDYQDTPPRSEAAEKAPRTKTAENRLEGRRKPNCGPGPESAGPGNGSQAADKGAAPAAAIPPERVLEIHKRTWANLAASIEAGQKAAARDYAAALCVLVEIIGLLKPPHGEGAKLKGEIND